MSRGTGRENTRLEYFMDTSACTFAEGQVRALMVGGLVSNPAGDYSHPVAPVSSLRFGGSPVLSRPPCPTGMLSLRHARAYRDQAVLIVSGYRWPGSIDVPRSEPGSGRHRLDVAGQREHLQTLSENQYIAYSRAS